MGCIASVPEKPKRNRKRLRYVGEIAVFVPGLRVPKSVNFSPLRNSLLTSLVERLSALRTRIVVMAAQEAPVVMKPNRRATTQHGGSSFSDLLQSLEDYLPVLLGLVKDGAQLHDCVPFVWINNEDDFEETTMANAWYEVLSVLHLMATLCLSEANSLLLTKSSDGYQSKLSEEARRKSVDVLLKGAGYLDCAVRVVLPQMTNQSRNNLPLDLTEEVLQALCLQALGQVVYIQLGMAIDSPKATLAVKRRLACEMVKYWSQALDNLTRVGLGQGWGKKHMLFIKWKSSEAKAAAYYYHGLILNEGNTEKSHALAVAALVFAEEFLRECKEARETFHSTPPTSRNPPLWSSLKCISDKIPSDASAKVRIKWDLYSNESKIESVPSLPDFPLALKPDDYQLPRRDPAWDEPDDNLDDIGQAYREAPKSLYAESQKH